MDELCNTIRKELFAMQDREYRDFHKKLIPIIDEDRIIGIRTPVLRKYAKECAKRLGIYNYLHELPHMYYEENNLHAFIIETINDYDKCMEELELFLPYIDNWATCDSLSPKVFKKNRAALLQHIKVWIGSDKVYTIRFAIGMLMRLYLDENFKKEYIDMVVSVHSDEYYINMMRAWYIATALAKQYDCAVEYIRNRELDNWTHNKAIQKAVESNRISTGTKLYLKSLKA